MLGHFPQGDSHYFYNGTRAFSWLSLHPSHCHSNPCLSFVVAIPASGFCRNPYPSFVRRNNPRARDVLQKSLPPCQMRLSKLFLGCGGVQTVMELNNSAKVSSWSDIAVFDNKKIARADDPSDLITRVLSPARQSTRQCWSGYLGHPRGRFSVYRILLQKVVPFGESSPGTHPWMGIKSWNTSGISDILALRSAGFLGSFLK
jgi:hypothetical protein